MARRYTQKVRTHQSSLSDIRETRLQLQIIACIGFVFLAAGLFFEQVLLR